MRFRTLLPALATLTILLAGCAPKPPAGDADELADYNERNDPLEPTNRKFYAVNSALDRNLLQPVASGYREAVPGTVREHLHNTLSNLGNPAQFANDVLQGHPRKAGNTFMRLLINTTVGAAGVFRRCDRLGLSGPRQRCRANPRRSGECPGGRSCSYPCSAPATRAMRLATVRTRRSIP